MRTYTERGEELRCYFRSESRNQIEIHKIGVVREDMVEQQHQAFGILLHSLRQLPLH